MSKFSTVAMVVILFAFCGVISAEDAFNVGPIQLLDFSSNEDKTVTLTENSIEKLFMDPLVYDRDVVVISIAGALRKGKSFLLNYMLRYLYANYKSVAFSNKTINETEKSNWIGEPDEPLKGFPWKSSSRRETVGIIFWSDVFLYDKPSGENIAIYLMDTQGLFDHSSSPTDNIRIFSLSSLISSVQIMNIQGTIEESHLEYLQFATEIAKFTAVEYDSSMKPFQKLFFIIRDWNSPEEYAYGLEGGNQFIKSVLTLKSFHTAELKTVRQYLQKTFERIECCLMPYPGKFVARNSSYDGRWKMIDEDFVEVMQELFPVILSPNSLTLKTINGMPIKAFELAVYVKDYVELFKSENLPEAKSIYETTLDKQFQILVSKCIEVYLESISLFQEKIKTADEVDQLHKISRAEALKYFELEKKFGSKNDSQVYRQELEEKLEKSFNEWKSETLEFLKKIEKEQEKSEEQNKLTNDAMKRNQQAQKDLNKAEGTYETLKKEIDQARFDTEESRQQAKILKQKLDKAEEERKKASAREEQARQYYFSMREKAEAYERQLAVERENNSQRVKEKVIIVRKQYGLLKWIGDGISGFFGFFARIFKPSY